MRGESEADVSSVRRERRPKMLIERMPPTRTGECTRGRLEYHHEDFRWSLQYIALDLRSQIVVCAVCMRVGSPGGKRGKAIAMSAIMTPCARVQRLRSPLLRDRLVPRDLYAVLVTAVKPSYAQLPDVDSGSSFGFAASRVIKHLPTDISQRPERLK